MSISLKTQKMLWGRAASRCAFPECKIELVMDATETDDESLVGEACHIVARSEDGPRGKSELTTEQRDKYSNLLLLCNIHHKIIDDQPGEYSVDALKTLRTKHESWVKSQLQTYDKEKQRDDEIYATYIEEFETYIDVKNWNAWTSYLLSHGQPEIGIVERDNLEELRTWLLNRVWPKRYEKLELAFENFRRVLQDLLNTFDKHSVKIDEDIYRTKKFYQNDTFEQERRHRLLAKFEHHCYLVEDLVLELTRAANYVFDHVRDAISPSYRLTEGILLVTSGPNMDMLFETYKVEYRGEQRTDLPYAGQAKFEAEQRFSRDFHFGNKA